MRSIPTPWRWIWRILAACLALYLVGGNVLLNTALGPRLVNQRPEGFRMTWSWGVTPWPGLLYLRGPVMHGHARWKRWSIEGRWALGRIEWLPLLRRRLAFAGVRAGEVRVTVTRAASERVPPPWSERAWTMVFDGIRTASLRQVRWYALQFDGEATVATGFSHQLRGGATQVFDSHLRSDGGRLSLAGRPLLDGMQLDLRGRIDPFRHGQPAGWDRLQLLHARLALDAGTPAVQPARSASARAWLRPGPSSSGGRVHAALAIEHGVLRDGGALTWDVPLTIAGDPGAVRQVPVHARLAVEGGGLHLSARAESAPGDPPRHAEADLRYAGRQLVGVPVRDALRRIDGSLRLRWHFASLGWLGPWLAKDWLGLEGEGAVDADLRLRRGVLQPGSHAELPGVNLRARVFDNLVAGHAHGRLTVADGADPGRLELSADHYTLAAAAAPQTVYLRGDDLGVSLRSTGDLAQFTREAHGRLHFRDARVPDLRTYNRYLPGDSVRILGGSGRSSADLTLGPGGAVTAGTLQLRGRGLDLALGVARLHTDLSMDARLAHAEKTAPRHYALSAFTVGLKHVRLDDADDRDWWATATLERGELDWNEPFRLRGDARLEMKDASVLLSLFARRHAFPAWIARIVDAGRMEATGQLAVGRRGDGKRRFVLDDVQAHNRRVDLKARLRILDGKPDGALYARWGILGLGVSLGGGRRDFHLLHAAAWYAAQPPLLDGAPPAP